MKRAVVITIIVAALGYFVDVYDLLIFSILRVPSLTSLNIAKESQLPLGLFLLNMQMGGMLFGGLFWGVLGDKRGRLSVLLGSIFLYSISNLANAFVTDINAYAICRFFAGFGLAGELGAGITLVSELMDRETRGYGTTLVASVGVAGAVFAALIGERVTWRHAYIIGGTLGLALLFLRVAIQESGLFNSLKTKRDVVRGDILAILNSREKLFRYLRCIFVGLPIWYVIGILITFSPEFGREFGITEPISAGRAVLYAYTGLVLGDLSCGLLSQYYRSRKHILAAYIILTGFCFTGYLALKIHSADLLYWACVPLGFSVGYWSVFVVNAAEQFGTNLRATVTTTVPNFIRGSVVPLTAAFEFFKESLGLLLGAFVVGAFCVTIALLALWGLKESFSRDLNYTE